MITAKDVLDIFPGAVIVEEPKRILCRHCGQPMLKRESEHVCTFCGRVETESEG